MKLENKTKAQLMKTADEIFSLYIRERDQHLCLFGLVLNDPCAGGHQCCHAISKGACSELRYDVNNAFDGCYKHHMFGWHGRNPLPYTDCFSKTYPMRKAYVDKVFSEYKKKLAEGVEFRPTKEYYIDKINTFRRKLKELKNATASDF